MRVREAAIAVRNLITGGNIAALPMLLRPYSAVSYVGECLFMKGCLDDAGMLPQQHVWQTLGQEIPMDVKIYGEAAAEWFRNVASFTADLVSLCMLCRIVKPRVIFEIGTYHGSGALHLAGNSPEAEVFTLDLPPNHVVSLDATVSDRQHMNEHARTRKMFFEGTPEGERVTQLFGDTAQFDFTPWQKKVDLFFIDGAHSYEYVRNDTLKALECCHPGSVIAWHDYGRFGINGVSRWLHEFALQGRRLHRIPGGSLAYMKA